MFYNMYDTVMVGLKRDLVTDSPDVMCQNSIPLRLEVRSTEVNTTQNT